MITPKHQKRKSEKGERRRKGRRRRRRGQTKREVRVISSSSSDGRGVEQEAGNTPSLSLPLPPLLLSFSEN